jgi:hypothetical protein
VKKDYDSSPGERGSCDQEMRVIDKTFR